MKVTVQTTGFKELERALVEDLPKTTAKAVLRRTALVAMKPVETRAKELAPKDDGELAAGITTKPVKAQRVSRTKYASQNGVAVATGPTGRPEGGNAGWQEHGTVNMPANPFMRPSWDSEHEAVLDNVRTELAAQIDKAKARIARKLAKGK